MLVHVTIWINLEDIFLSEIKPDTKGKIFSGSAYMRYLEGSN